eukprot:SAG25_NODE_5_length_29351_cov_43.404335_27_plen_124_part_00
MSFRSTHRCVPARTESESSEPPPKPSRCFALLWNEFGRLITPKHLVYQRWTWADALDLNHVHVMCTYRLLSSHSRGMAKIVMQAPCLLLFTQPYTAGRPATTVALRAVWRAHTSGTPATWSCR